LIHYESVASGLTEQLVMAILIHHFRGADMQQTRKAKVDAAYVAKVDAAIQKIQEFFQIGQELTQKQSHKASYGQDTVGAEAKKYNLNPDTIRKARQFADPVRGYTASEVKELCSLIRTLQTNQRGAIFGRTHLIRLLSVPKQKRGKVQKLAIERRGSMAELESLTRIFHEWLLISIGAFDSTFGLI